MVTVTFATFQAKDYELRQYETAKWVSTVIRGETQKEAMRQGFWKLFRYIQGKNERGRTCWFWIARITSSKWTQIIMNRRGAGRCSWHLVFHSSRNEDWYDCASDLPRKIRLHRLQDLFLCAIWAPGLSPPAHWLQCVYWGTEGSNSLCPVSKTRTADTRWIQVSSCPLSSAGYTLRDG